MHTLSDNYCVREGQWQSLIVVCYVFILTYGVFENALSLYSCKLIVYESVSAASNTFLGGVLSSFLQTCFFVD